MCAGLTVLAGCSSNAAPTQAVGTTTHTVLATTTPSAGMPIPTDIGAELTTEGSTCPLIDIPGQAMMDLVGMRLVRLTVTRQASKPTGCAIYALQDSSLHNSEHLPGPNQPAIKITLRTYRSATDAHNAFVLTAEQPGNTNTQQRDITGADGPGLCYQTTFDPADHGQDWTCGFTRHTSFILVQTVVLTPALNVVELAGHVTAG